MALDEERFARGGCQRELAKRQSGVVVYEEGNCGGGAGITGIPKKTNGRELGEDEDPIMRLREEIEAFIAYVTSFRIEEKIWKRIGPSDREAIKEMRKFIITSLRMCFNACEILPDTIRGCFEALRTRFGTVLLDYHKYLDVSNNNNK
jgi:hypothetical protein